MCRLGTCLYDFFVIDIDDEELSECDDEDFTQEDKDVSKLINDFITNFKKHNDHEIDYF